MKIEVLVPTLAGKGFDREKSLVRLLDSLDVPCEVRVQRETTARGGVLANNMLMAQGLAGDADLFLVVCDDFEFKPGAIAGAVELFEDIFEGTDGVVALKQANILHIPDVTEFGCVMIGREFLERFRGEFPYCPDYYHFYGDTELGLFAKHTGQYIFAEHCEVIHHHPMFSNAPKDNTHKAARLCQMQDNAMWKKRRAAGLLWGRTFERGL